MDETSINVTVSNGAAGVVGAKVVRIENLYVGSVASGSAQPTGRSGGAGARFGTLNRPRWFVSYAWADESDPKREKQVDELCEAAKSRNVSIVRDKTTLSRGDRISEFMEKIGEGDRVFIFLSSKYLRSPYCMFELFEIWRNNRQDKANFLGHVRFFAIDGAKIGKPEEWLRYTKFWQQERNKLKQAIDRVGWQDAGEEATKRFRNIETFAGKISDVLALFADVVQPRTFEDFLIYGFEDPSETAEEPALRSPDGLSPVLSKLGDEQSASPLKLDIVATAPDYNGAMSIVHRLRQPVILELKTAIEAAFKAAELDQLISLTFSDNLYKVYVPKYLKGGYNTTALLTSLSDRGIVDQFLRAVRIARPDDTPLLKAIEIHCPAAMENGPVDSATLETVINGLMILEKSLKDPTTNQAIIHVMSAKQDELRSLERGLQRLRAYKALHDTLQKVQLDHYRVLNAQTKKLCEDPNAAEALGSQVQTIRRLCLDAESDINVLKDTPADFGDEIKWITILANALDQLESAIDELDDFAARSTVKEIRDVIRYEPPRVNSQLRKSAENLPLDSLILTIAGIRSVAGVQFQKPEALDLAEANLESLWADVRGRVATHNRWQDVEAALWGADDEIERELPELNDFKIYWRATNHKLKALWDLDPLAEWVQKTRRFGDDIDAALVMTPVDLPRVKRSYNKFRGEALNRFFVIDKNLKNFCENILELSKPLNAMLIGLPR
jgi:hypothetical protein